MKKINVEEVRWDAFASPKGKFRSSFKEISVALGAKRNAPAGLDGHPFDLTLEKLAPGESGCPYHEHAAQWELFYILSGNGTVRADGESYAVRSGDVIMHPPGEAHQILNTGSEELLYLIVADNPPLGVCQYPDSKKWGVYSPSSRHLFRMVDVDYWDGEE